MIKVKKTMNLAITYGTKKLVAFTLIIAMLSSSILPMNAQASNGFEWRQISGKWYYVNTSTGAPKTGWHLDADGSWYFLKTNSPDLGSMLIDWQLIDGGYYYFQISSPGSGRMLTGWQHIGSDWYYLHSSGRMLVGWQQINNQWYYLQEASPGSGKMLTGWQKISGSMYYFNNSGVWISGLTDSSVLLNQAAGSDTCTLVSATNMLRRKAILDGRSYTGITEASVRTVAWAPGLRHDFTYSGTRVISTSVSGNTIASKKSTLINLLASRPEGVVVHYGSLPHAVLICYYDGSTFYAYDPINSASYNKIIPLKDTWLTGTTQDNVINGLTRFWYIQ